MKTARALLLACTLLPAAAAAQPPARPSAQLLREFAAADDLRAFALSALQRPAEGGHFYARYVASECGRDYAAVARLGEATVQKEIARTGSVPAWRLELMQDLPRRCASFAPGETTSILAGLKTRSGDTSDPLLVAERDLIAAARSRHPEALRPAVRRLLQIDDPMLWTAHRLYDFAAQADPQARSRLGLFLDGKVISPADQQSHLEASTALDLGFCTPGLPCAADDLLRVVCAAGGDCAPDRERKARDLYLANGGSEAGWRRVTALADRIREARRSGTVSMFVRQPPRQGRSPRALWPSGAPASAAK